MSLALVTVELLGGRNVRHAMAHISQVSTPIVGAFSDLFSQSSWSELMDSAKRMFLENVPGSSVRKIFENFDLLK